MGVARRVGVLQGWPIAGGVGLFALLIGLSEWNYLAFHGIAEVLAIILAVTVFVFAWIVGEPPENRDYFRFMGIAFFWLVPILALHMMAFPGVQVFPRGGENLTTQLWLISRYAIAANLAVAPWYLGGRRLRPAMAWTTFGVVTMGVVATTVTTDLFPSTFVVGQGITTFMMGAESGVMVLLGVAAITHWRARRHLSRDTLGLVAVGLAALAATELSFAVVLTDTSFTNAVGHFFQIVALNAFVGAFVIAGIRRPAQALGRRVAESEQLFRRLAEDAPIAVFVTSLEGEIVFSNELFRDLVGSDLDDLAHGGWLSRLPEPERSQAERAWYEAAGCGACIDISSRVESPDGVVRDVLVRAAPLCDDDDEATGYLGNILDVTELATAERAVIEARDRLEVTVAERTGELQEAVAELELANNIKDEFIANIRHELRTPLNSIIGFSAILRDGLAGPVNEEQHRQLEMVYDAGVRLHELIKDVMYVSRIESGNFDLSSEQFDVASLVHAVARELEPEARRKGLEFSLDAAQIEVRSDPWAIGKIIGHLAANAVKFTDEGSVSIQVRQKGDRIALVVTDTGAGIPQEEMDQVFERFRQVRPAEGGKAVGTGIGLSMVKTLSELLGGELHLTSDPGKGTRAVVTIPFDLPVIDGGRASDAG